VAEAFVTAAIVFCVGPLTFLDRSGTASRRREPLTVKSVLDGFTAIALAATLGWAFS